MAINSSAGIDKHGKIVSPCYRCFRCGEGFEHLKDAEAHEHAKECVKGKQ